MLHIKRLTETAKLPTRAHPTDAGLDLYADETVNVPHFGRAIVKTGVAVAIPDGYVGLIWPRSGLASKGISTDAGVIDCGYTGEVGVVITNGTVHTKMIQQGEKIAQLLIQPIWTPELAEVDDLDGTARGAGGWGSTGE